MMFNKENTLNLNAISSRSYEDMKENVDKHINELVRLLARSAARDDFEELMKKKAQEK